MKFIAMAALGLAALAGSANAAVFIVTYTGTVTGGNDQTNYFGLGKNLTLPNPDPQFTLQFTFDPATPKSNFVQVGDSAYLAGYGDSNKNNPIVEASFTMNGVTMSWGSSYADGYGQGFSQVKRTDGAFDRIEAQSSDYLQNGNNFDLAQAFLASDRNFIRTLDLAASLTYQRQAGDLGEGQLRSLRFASGVASRDVTLNLRPDQVSVRLEGAAAPEPAAWALMIAGFGLVGATLRRRRARAIA